MGLAPREVTTSSVGPHSKRPSVAARVAGPTSTEAGRATDCRAAAPPPLPPQRHSGPSSLSQWGRLLPGRSQCRRGPTDPQRDHRLRLPRAEGSQYRPLRVVLMGNRGTKQRYQAGARDRGDRPGESLHLGDDLRQGPAYELAQVLWAEPLASSCRPGQLGEEHTHEPALFHISDGGRVRRGLSASGKTCGSGRGPANLLEGRGDAQPQILEGGPAALVGTRHQLLTSLGCVDPHQRGRGLLRSWVVGQAVFPGFNDPLWL